ncbi:MAG: hypothetical protein R3C02_07600 [Planctomycetaceae bacterium]
MMVTQIRIFLAAMLLVAMLPNSALAYIGPGAEFALAGSFLAVFGAIFSAILMILSWPVRRSLRFVLRRKPPEQPRFKRVVVLGLDGLDHGLTEQLLAEGKLPNLAALRDQGDFSRWPARCRRFPQSLGRRFKRVSIRASTTSSTS